MSDEIKPCPFCGSPAMADSGFAPAESIIYAYCSSNDCQLHHVDVGMTPEEWNQRALPAINPEPPTVAVTWHDSPESVHRAMWEESAVAEGMTYDQMIDESVSCGEDEHGNEIEFTHEQEIAGMRQQGCWAFVDARSNMIHAWADESAPREFVLHMLAHEIGHVTGDAHADDFQEEMRAEQFGRVARAAYRLLPPVKADYAALEAEREMLRQQVAALQSDANSWQSGYDKGREDGAKAADGWKAQHARDSAELRRLCSERDHLKACQENAQLHITGLVAERNAALRQRDKLAWVLRKVLVTHDYHTDDGEEAADAARAALSELTP